MWKSSGLVTAPSSLAPYTQSSSNFEVDSTSELNQAVQSHKQIWISARMWQCTAVWVHMQVGSSSSASVVNVKLLLYFSHSTQQHLIFHGLGKPGHRVTHSFITGSSTDSLKCYGCPNCVLWGIRNGWCCKTAWCSN